MTKRRFIFSGFVFFCSWIFAVAIPKSNYDLIDSLVKSASNLIIGSARQSDNDTFRIEFNRHPAAWLVREEISKSAENRKAGLKIKDSGLPFMEIAIKDCGVAYEIYPDDNDTLIRIINVSISGILTTKDGKIIPLPEYSSSLKDKISVNDLPFVQSAQHDFANSPVPVPPKSFFRQLAEPFIVISTAALVVVLLFTVRSH